MPSPKRPEMQYKTRSKVIQTKEGEALAFGFQLGPISVYVIANIPSKFGNEGALVYVKVNLNVFGEWQEHSTESNPRVRQ
jgi:hypothetical protein